MLNAFHTPAREVTQHAEAQDREQGVAGSSSASILYLKDSLLAPGTQHSVPSVQGGPGGSVCEPQLAGPMQPELQKAKSQCQVTSTFPSLESPKDSLSE